MTDAHIYLQTSLPLWLLVRSIWEKKRPTFNDEYDENNIFSCFPLVVILEKGEEKYILLVNFHIEVEIWRSSWSWSVIEVEVQPLYMIDIEVWPISSSSEKLTNFWNIQALFVCSPSVYVPMNIDEILWYIFRYLWQRVRCRFVFIYPLEIELFPRVLCVIWRYLFVTMWMILLSVNKGSDRNKLQSSHDIMPEMTLGDKKWWRKGDNWGISSWERSELVF